MRITEQPRDVKTVGRDPVRILRVDAESGDEIAQAGHSQITIVVRRSIADLRSPGPHYEYAIFLPDDDFAEDYPSFVAGVPGYENAPAEMLGRAVVADWKQRFPR